MKVKTVYHILWLCERVQALGSLYFVHHSVTSVEMFDFHGQICAEIFSLIWQLLKLI